VADSHVVMSEFHSVPQKLPTFDTKSAASSGLFNIAQGLPLKHCSSEPHSSPLGQGTASAQFSVCSCQDVPQKLVLINGDWDGAGVGDADGIFFIVGDGDDVVVATAATAPVAVFADGAIDAVFTDGAIDAVGGSVGGGSQIKSL